VAGRKKYAAVQIVDGVWYRMRGYTHTECCDCALVHREEFRVVDGHIEWRAMRDDKRTATRRRERGITVSEESPPGKATEAACQSKKSQTRK
jgi:hypothetical protein